MNTTLYPGIPFSPQTTITNNIGAADSIIGVSDVSAFPPAPNLATIGTDEEGETILYTAKTETALSGCQRGVEGEAKGWAAGALIGRNFTAKDHADLIAAVTEAYGAAEAAQEAAGSAMDVAQTAQEAAATAGAIAAAQQPKLTGQPGQVVGFDTDGAAVAHQADAAQVSYDGTQSGLQAETVQGAVDALSARTARVSNPNLLDNWYFVDPINQKGQAEYTEAGYTIDRWSSTGLTVTLEDGWIKLQNNTDVTKFFSQNAEISQFRALVWNKVTVSLLYKTVTPGCTFYCGYLPKGGSFIRAISLSLSANNNDWNLSYGTSSEIPNIDVIQWQHASISVPPNGELCIKAAKLELGSVQTLAHKEGDAWVLNDPPPNKALELAKCQRYQVFGHLLATPYTQNGSTYWCSLPLQTTMRAIPSMIGNPIARTAANNDEVTGAVISVDALADNAVYIGITGVSEPVYVMGTFGLDANL